MLRRIVSGRFKLRADPGASLGSKRCGQGAVETESIIPAMILNSSSDGDGRNFPTKPDASSASQRTTSFSNLEESVASTLSACLDQKLFWKMQPQSAVIRGRAPVLSHAFDRYANATYVMDRTGRLCLVHALRLARIGFHRHGILADQFSAALHLSGGHSRAVLVEQFHRALAGVRFGRERAGLQAGPCGSGYDVGDHQLSVTGGQTRPQPTTGGGSSADRGLHPGVWWQLAGLL